MKLLFENWRKYLREQELLLKEGLPIPSGLIGNNMMPYKEHGDDEVLITEDANDIADLPDNWFIKVTDTMQNDFSIIRAEIVQKIGGQLERVPGKTTPFSIIQAMGAGPIEEDPCLDAYIIQKSAAPQGFGPLLYDIILELAGQRGVTPDRMTVSKDAFGVWDFYLNNRSDIKKAQLDDPANTLTPQDDDNCRQDSSLNYNPEDWDKSPLSKVYYKLNREKITALEKVGKILYGEKTPKQDKFDSAKPELDTSDESMYNIIDDYDSGDFS